MQICRIYHSLMSPNATLKAWPETRRYFIRRNNRQSHSKGYKKGFRNWKEKTTTSLSGRHLWNHHSLLTPDGVQYSKEKEDFSERMWRLHHKIISIALLNTRPLRRWRTSIVILIPKDKGTPKMHRLRIINTYESEYNLILKYFWPKVGMKKSREE